MRSSGANMHGISVSLPTNEFSEIIFSVEDERMFLLCGEIIHASETSSHSQQLTLIQNVSPLLQTTLLGQLLVVLEAFYFLWEVCIFPGSVGSE